MHSLRFVVAVLGAALAIAATAVAAPRFNGKVCTFVPAARVASISGVSARCTNTPPAKGLGSTLYVGNWAGRAASTGGLQVTIAVYTDRGALQLATRNLNQGHVGSTHKVTGIGKAAFEATGSVATDIHFAVGNYVVYVTLNAIARPAKTSLEALARYIAARL